ncbi:DUF7619 domain-containing protein [Flavobacterium subsaxonicum]|uniref:DUF7619 domain-containing protein n=1 Tax=Flavobacterium subsaxonicum TaxID=426226 RepID=UPI0003F9740A|nr:T9SS type A sorting domain-containing protein [Flavobacterium subsaxonicum]
MIKKYILLFLLTSFYASAQNIVFADPNLKTILTHMVIGEYNFSAYDSSENIITVDANGDGEIQVSEAQAVYGMGFAYYDNIPWLNVVSNLGGLEYFTNLRELTFADHNISTVNLSALVHLKEIYCRNNNITSLNISGLTELELLNCQDNNLTALNVQGLTALKNLTCSNNHITALNLSGLNLLNILYVSNNELTELDIDNFSDLEEVQCFENNLTSLSVTGLPNLYLIDCSNNNLTSLTLQNLPGIGGVSCAFNQLTELDLSAIPNLLSIECAYNPLTSLDLSYDNQLTSLAAFSCQLTSLDVSGCKELDALTVSYNQLTSIDLSNSLEVWTVNVDNNLLEYLNVKNGHGTNVSYFLDNNPNLHYICADEDELWYLEQTLQYLGYDCQLNTYCTFMPGGVYNTVTGNARFDLNANGCDEGDVVYPGLAVAVSNEQNSATFTANTQGIYTIPAQEGSHTITPVNPNPLYFTITPATQTVYFYDNGQADTTTQNFCLSPVGPFNDLDVTLLPVTVARPGFNGIYRLIYKNSGTTTLSGNVTLSYMDDVLDYVSATTVPAANTNGLLSWNFTSLLPFQEVVIDVVLNTNSPIETPAVNINDVLDFTAAIAFEGADETPLNNIYSFNQTVVGSFDPNDKTCVEGTTITPDMVGGYVTYMIRFENTGTYMAENIVVKDMIDATKFDVSTLTPLQSSHPYITRITGNKAEFFFENIMLPGTPSQERHGFVAFKIKTLPTLSLNDSFSNTAEIYFDYNAPIVTNEAETTVALPLSNPDFDFKNFVTLYPNPAGNTLNLDVKGSLSVKNIAVYNMLGQQLISIVNAGNKLAIDVAGLAAGSYIIKVGTDKGTSATKFIKK